MLRGENVNKMETIKTKKTKLALSILAIVVIGAFTQHHLSDASTNQEVSVVNDEYTQTLPLPPPIPLRDIGIRSVSFDDAKSQTGLSQAFTPSYVPNGLVVESARHILDPNGNRIVILYLPDGTITSEETYIGEVIDKGMAIEIVREQNDDNFSWNDYVTQAVKENPTIRSSTMINNHQVLLIKKNPEINYPNMAKIMFGNIRIEVASDQIDPLELSKVMRSMITH
jgi:hypothetical protein